MTEVLLVSYFEDSLSNSELKLSAPELPGTTRTYPLRAHQSEGSPSQDYQRWYF